MPTTQVYDPVPLPPIAAPTVWLATADGLACTDMNAVERAVRGERCPLTRDEARFAAGLMLGHLPGYVVAARTGVSRETVRTWYPRETPS
ncbi:hypothetical protein [Streptomyces sp. NPDC002640]